MAKTIGVVLSERVLAGLVVSHYSTSYVAVALLGSTWVVYGFFRALARLRHRKPARPRVGSSAGPEG